MPVKVVKRGDVWRVIEASTGRIARATTRKGKGKGLARDGGGKKSRAQANKLARAINAQD